MSWSRAANVGGRAREHVNSSGGRRTHRVLQDDEVAGQVMALATVWPTFARLSMSTHLVVADLHWPTVVMASTVNPVFEEVLVCGYVITALKGRVGTTTAVKSFLLDA